MVISTKRSCFVRSPVGPGWGRTRWLSEDRRGTFREAADRPVSARKKTTGLSRSFPATSSSGRRDHDPRQRIDEHVADATVRFRPNFPRFVRSIERRDLGDETGAGLIGFLFTKWHRRFAFRFGLLERDEEAEGHRGRCDR